ncbi:MAG: 23S rRNA (pseudouridine(1915)-N(3))-methyltransferase RlmH [Mycoplasmataceae bacterium]|jgi:23S rRNA (pseudouridine1915-N3)-methyltransferase|nr:23S rRNA (pseudouridine(1915)-N(3))-methyltransferase RlmH [Mycoplasmataceae bacterium]
MIKVVAIGKKTEYDNKIDDYAKRLINNFKTTICCIKHSTYSGNQARDFESNEIFKKIKPSDFVVLLDERGGQLTNIELCKKITNNSNVVFIVGGPYGVNEHLRKRANFMLSLSKLVLPYEISRLILIEQIYRTQEIFLNHPYHHE